MNIGFERAALHLKAHQFIRLYDPEGARVECVSGALWITQNRDPRDHMLESQGTLLLDKPGLALIHAQEPSEVVVIEPAPRPGLGRRIGRALGSALRSVGQSLRRTFGPESLDGHRQPGWYHGL